MHSPEAVADALRLGAAGRSATEISTMLGIPRRTISDWLAGATPKRARERADNQCPHCGWERHDFSAKAASYIYLLGLYLGDGYISAGPRGVYRLRVTLDAKYPGIIDECVASVRQVAPRNEVNRVLRGGPKAGGPTHVDVSCYSRSWPCLFPQHGAGKKHERRIALDPWQQDLVRLHPKPLLRGLVHSDGCRAMNTGTNWAHPRYSFRNLSEDILGIFIDACRLVGAHHTTAPRTVYVSRKADVALLDGFIGPKS